MKNEDLCKFIIFIYIYYICVTLCKSDNIILVNIITIIINIQVYI